MSFLALPPEILERILVQSIHNGSPESISTISQTCKGLKDLIDNSSDTTIWREVYLSILDSPFVPQKVIAKFLKRKDIPEEGEFDWKKRVVTVISLQKQLKTLDLSENLDEYIFTLSELATAPIPVFPDQPCRPSLNLDWLDKLLTNGFPKPLVDRLMEKSHHPTPTVAAVASASDLVKWEITNVGQQFYRLVLQTGFWPHQAVTTPTNTNNYISPDKQEELTRVVARLRVYDILYPSASKCWGPFLPRPASSSLSSSSSSSSVLDSSQSKEPHLLVPDYPFLSAARMVVETDLRESLEADNDGGMMIVFDGGPKVWPFFTYESAERDVDEFLEKVDGVDVGDDDDSEGKRGLNALRMGSAPGFWDGEGTKERWLGVDGGSEIEEALGTSDQPYTEGWDWAGVEGTWTRATCSIENPQLLYQFNYDMLENCQVSSMRLRITGYSRVHRSDSSSSITVPPEPMSLSGPSSTPRPFVSSALQETDKVPDAQTESAFVKEEEKYKDVMDSLVYALPVIHFSDEQPGVQSERTIRGTASMISGGNVRWSMISRDNLQGRDRWVLEAVQIGGIGSGLGAVGMWTGVRHENGDLVGPMWMWRVA
ncbi:hypothetical protein K435DRAFT_781037 [Dendrothele bispora CBS 962.96]|uniref:Uncharacterized protein n=1 Tax=Dendrothele bispora (strain CBS 962.96) TaxID=1314807 RepID=A0A4S8LNB8_DENBC|nr:hypothetical protein K435DRAFT_781037 [Dendrothele bispora CBS 962.96]